MTGAMFSAGVLLLAFSLSLINWLGRRFVASVEPYHYHMLSFGGGVMLTMTILVLLPKAVEGGGSPLVFLLILMGYIVFHLTEKALFQHTEDEEEMLRELGYLHSASFVLGHFFMGVTLATVLESTPVIGLLIIVPLFMQVSASTLALSHVHEGKKKSRLRAMLSLSPFIGALVTVVIGIPETVRPLVLSFMIGVLLYLVNRDILPKGKKGYPRLFVVGMLLVLLVWVLITGLEL